MRQLSDPVAELKAKLDEERRKIRERHNGLPPPDDGPRVCQTCKGAGWLSLPFDPMKSTIQELTECRDCPSEVQLERHQAVLRRSGLERHAHVTFDTVPPLPDQEAYWEEGMDYANNPQGWLVLSGHNYVGKSWLAASIGNWWTETGKMVLFRDMVELMKELRNSIGHSHYNDVLRELKEVPCLVLDDYGHERDTEFVREARYELTFYRMDMGLPTVVTMNYSMDELKARDSKLYYRLADTTKARLIVFANEPIVR